MRIVSVLDKVAGTISRYSMVRPGIRLGVAVSGGIDSVCLLDILRRLDAREGWGLELAVIHLNHQLRGAQSDGDEQFVGELAASANLRLYSERVTLPPGNIEDQGREARRLLFAALVSDGKVDAVATGHTRSDQAETVLFRVLRGTGLTGLAGILPVTQEKLIRPLLGVSRRQVEEYAREQGLRWRDDASNADTSLARNSLRHHWLPQLSEEWNPRLEDALANLAEVAQAEEAHWEAYLSSRWQQWTSPYAGGLVIGVKLLQEMDLATQRRVIRRCRREVKGESELGLDQVDAIRELIERKAGDGRIQTAGLDVMKSFDWVRFTALGAGDQGSRFWSFRIRAGERVPIPGGELELAVVETSESVEGECLYNEGSRLVDASVFGEALEIRSWRPGDRLNGQKVKQLFQEARIPLWQRRDWPVLVSGDEVLWTRTFGVDERWRPRETSMKLLEVREFRDGAPR